MISLKFPATFNVILLVRYCLSRQGVGSQALNKDDAARHRAAILPASKWAAHSEIHHLLAFFGHRASIIKIVDKIEILRYNIFAWSRFYYFEAFIPLLKATYEPPHDVCKYSIRTLIDIKASFKYMITSF